MSTPSWPRLAGWMALATPGSMVGRWLRVDKGVTQQGTFARRADGQHIALSDDGRLSSLGLRASSLLWDDIDRTDDDYHRAVGPVRPVQHDGRSCWQVQLEPPARKKGLLTVIVDEATGLLFRQSNEDFGFMEEVTDLRLDVVVDDAVFVPLDEERASRAREIALHELFTARPAPTPRWFPWRSGYLASPDCVAVWGSHGEGSVGRAPLGSPAPVDDFMGNRQVHRFDAVGWSWAIASEVPISESDARQVVAYAEFPS